jgi:hypothetical protein
MLSTRMTAITGALLLTGLSAPAVHAQSAVDIIDRMLVEHERRSADVDNYTIVQRVMGVETYSYFEKEMVDGRPVFRQVSSGAAGVRMDSPTEGTLDEIYAAGEELAESAEYAGRETIDGNQVHVLDVPDLANTEFASNMQPDADFEPRRGRFYVDADTYVPRRMEFDGEMTNDSGTHLISATIDMLDYRDVEGMLMPYRVTVSVEGIGAVIDEETRAEFEQVRRQLEGMPADQRRMVEAMMGDQLEQFRRMMQDDSEPMVIDVEVQEVRVNAGPPGGA